ncbi:MAG: hypothetical protein LBV68_05055, partial [Spirochaetaceae bacterium]|nr:hypothetical protein [Spirochaetaceae bacterium]
MRHFLFEDKEYKFHLNYRRRRPDNNFRDLIKHQKKIKSGGSGFKTDTRQKCIVKTHYSFNMKAHKTQIEKYLTRDGTDINGNAATLYGSDLNEYKKNMVDKNFRIFLSPQSNKIDLENLTKSFV